MLSATIRSAVQKLWDKFWASGITNPLTALEQITYLIFLRRLEDVDDERRRRFEEIHRTEEKAVLRRVYASPLMERRNCRWSYLRQLPSDERFHHVRGPVFDWLKQLRGAEERMRDAVFLIPTPGLLDAAVEIIDQIFVSSPNHDTTGEIYEFLLSEVSESGKSGQFRTPRHIVRLMCDLVDPAPGQRLCDPVCGTAGFLVHAYQHILKRHTRVEALSFEADGTALGVESGPPGLADDPPLIGRTDGTLFAGYDSDRTMVRLGWMNMVLHGLERAEVDYADALGSSFNQQLTMNGGSIGEFDVVLGNPPFTGSVDEAEIGRSLRRLETTKTELLFVELALQLLRNGGRAALIVPEGVLFGATSAHKRLRQKLVQENCIDAVVSLPGGVFQPSSGAKTSILLFTKGGSTSEVWFYDVLNDGFALNARRTRQPETNDLWDLTVKFYLRNAGRFTNPAPAFVAPPQWAMLTSLSAEDLAGTYVQPLFQEEQRQVIGGVEQVTLFKGIELRRPAPEQRIERRAWTATVDEITRHDFNLSAGRYKPFTPAEAAHESPAETIRELQQIEQKIQAGLSELLAMVEEGK